MVDAQGAEQILLPGVVALCVKVEIRQQLVVLDHPGARRHAVAVPAGIQPAIGHPVERGLRDPVGGFREQARHQATARARDTRRRLFDIGVVQRTDEQRRVQQPVAQRQGGIFAARSGKWVGAAGDDGRRAQLRARGPTEGADLGEYGGGEAAAQR